MSKYIIFGAGTTGGIALDFLGYERVICFIDNYKSGTELYGKPVRSFQELLEMDTTECVIAVCSEKYFEELEQQLIEAKIENYFVFREVDVWKSREYFPSYLIYRKREYLSYARVLAQYSIKNFRNIVILGVNPFLHYLIDEIAIQHDISSIIGIVDPLGQHKEESIMGIPFISLEAAERKADCIIVNIRKHENKYADYIDDNRYQYGYDIIDLYDVDRFETAFWHPELEQFHNIHNGKRIWLIGNGPSLKFEDLEILHQRREICLGFNNVYKAYDRTNWRARYLLMTDQRIMEASTDIASKVNCPVFWAYFHHIDTDFYGAGVHYIHYRLNDCYPNTPRFSENIITGVYGGNTVTYVGFQLANYMGASEIYLLGMDNTHVGKLTDERNHFIPGYFSAEELEKLNDSEPVWEQIDKAYEKARKHLEKRGVRIFNATRGGQLEVFDRVDFDSLF